MCAEQGSVHFKTADGLFEMHIVISFGVVLSSKADFKATPYKDRFI